MPHWGKTWGQGETRLGKRILVRGKSWCQCSEAEVGLVSRDQQGRRWGWRRHQGGAEVGDEVQENIRALRPTVRISAFTGERWGVIGEFWAEACPTLIYVLRGHLSPLCGKYMISIKSKSGDQVGDGRQNPKKGWEYLGSQGQQGKRRSASLICFESITDWTAWCGVWHTKGKPAKVMTYWEEKAANDWDGRSLRIEECFFEGRRRWGLVLLEYVKVWNSS